MKETVVCEQNDIVITTTRHDPPLLCVKMGREEYAFLTIDLVDELITILQKAKSLLK